MINSEIRLIIAILLRSLFDLYDKNKIVRRKAVHFVSHWTIRDVERPYSFPWLCDNLNVCPYTLRKKLFTTDFKVSLKQHRNSYSSLVAVLDDETQYTFLAGKNYGRC